MDFSVAFLRRWHAAVFCKKRPLATLSNHGLIDRLSHELRTSLTGIVGYSEYVEAQSAEPMVNFTAQMIRESGENLTRSSHAFYALHRLSTGQLPLSLSDFSIREVCRNVVRKYRAQAAEHDVHLYFSCTDDASLCRIHSDEKHIQKILETLVLETFHLAIEPSEMHIHLSVDATKTSFHLHFEESRRKRNIGRDQLLDDFWNRDDYAYKLQEGPGIEMAYAKALVLWLNGHVRYESPPDMNPILHITLPARLKARTPHD